MSADDFPVIEQSFHDSNILEWFEFYFTESKAIYNKPIPAKKILHYIKNIF